MNHIDNAPQPDDDESDPGTDWGFSLSVQTPAQRIVALRLGWLHDETGSATATLADLARFTGLSDRHARRVISSLVAAGHITIHPGPRRGEFRYRLVGLDDADA